MSEDITQEELQGIRDRATKMGREVKNQLWKRAYLRLADAANILDAMETRTIEKNED